MKLLLHSEYADTTFRYSVPVDHVARDEMMAWCNDPSRPGYYRMDTAWNIDSLKYADQDEYLVMTLHVTDRDVAFEARMRWS